jgi:hypothetical protein
VANMDNELIAKILAIIGAVIFIIVGIFDLVNFNLLGTLLAIIYFGMAVVLILMFIKPGEPIPLNGYLILLIAVIGIVLALIYGNVLLLVGGILVLIAGILVITKK